MTSNRLAAWMIVALAAPAAAAPLGAPSLAAGQDIRVETGEITVNAASTTVVRYTWRDSAGNPRSVSLVPASGATSGYALQMTYMVNDGGLRTVSVDADPVGDGGFGYFVSHELYRDFDGNGSGDGSLAALHGEDDSPLGRYLASTGTAQSVGAAQAAHEFRLNYPRWGTVAAMADPSAPTSAALATHQKFQLPVVIRWHFVAGRDHPLWSVEVDLTAAADHIANDVRGPYGVMSFNEGVGNRVTALRWGDKYHFAADAGAADLAAAATPANGTAWAWNTANTGRRYNVLSSGAYEFGLVDTVPHAASKYADGFAFRRNSTQAAMGGCDYGMRALPCDWEWPYQSMQFEGVPGRPKLAWGSSAFLGSSVTPVYVNANETEPLIDAKGRIQYGLHIVLGRSGNGAPLTLARAAAPIEADPTLTLAASPAGAGTVSFTVLGDGNTYTATRALKPWNSVRLVATPAAGQSFTGWSGACAGVAGSECLITMDQSRSVTANFTGGGAAALQANPALLAFGGQSMNTTSPAMTTTLTNGSAGPIAVTGVSASAGYAVASNNCATVASGASCTVGVTFTPPVAGATAVMNGTLTVSYTGGPTTVDLSGTAERSLVTHYYRSILRRAPDSGGKGFWENEATRVTGLGAEVNEVWYAMAMQFYTSPEYAAFNRDDAGFVTDLYNTFFNRAPDSGGLGFWVNNLASGMPREVALAEFMFSNEFRTFSRAIFGGPTGRVELSAVMDFYRGLLARTPDGGGFNYWVGRFRAAQCQGSAAVVSEVEAISSAFTLSGEYAARARSNAQYVGDLYNAFLRRGGDLAGVQFWINQIASGARTRENVRIEFRNSPEFQGRVNAVIAQGCL